MPKSNILIMTLSPPLLSLLIKYYHPSSVFSLSLHYLPFVSSLWSSSSIEASFFPHPYPILVFSFRHQSLKFSTLLNFWPTRRLLFPSHFLIEVFSSHYSWPLFELPAWPSAFPVNQQPPFSFLFFKRHPLILGHFVASATTTCF